ncbi:hypothetical protein Tco_0115283 [Tanacetum coccineum]
MVANGVAGAGLSAIECNVNSTPLLSGPFDVILLNFSVWVTRGHKDSEKCGVQLGDPRNMCFEQLSPIAKVRFVRLHLKTDKDGEFGKLDPLNVGWVPIGSTMQWADILTLEANTRINTIRGFQTGSNRPKVVFYFLQAVTFSWRDPMFLENAPRLRSASISATVYSCRRGHRDIRLLSVHWLYMFMCIAT